MPSWRDTVSEQAQADLDSLLGTLLEFAQQTLAKHGVVAPFGAAISATGEMRLLGALPDADEGSPQALEMLLEGIRAERSSLRAFAIASDVRLTEGGDAIRVE